MLRMTRLFALALCLPASTLAADWPQFRGPNADGICPETGINKDWRQKPPKVLWQTRMSDDGYAGPAVAGGKLYIVDHNADQDIVRCFDLATGKGLWWYAINDTDKANNGYCRSTPVINEGKVYTLSRLGFLACFDPEKGAPVWGRDIINDFRGKRPGWDLGMSPFVDGDKVIVCPGGPNAAVAALDKNTGKTIWQGGGSDPPGYATPVAATIAAKRQYVVFTGYSVAGVDAGTGALLWSYPWKTEYDINAAAPIVIGESVLVTSGYGHGGALLEISAAGVKPRWQSKDLQSKFTSPVLINGHAYCTGEHGNLVCVDVATGQTRWMQAGFEWGGSVAVDGVLIVANGKDGDLAMVQPSPDGYQELGRIKPLGGQSWTAPIVADGKLIVRNKSTLACLDLK